MKHPHKCTKICLYCEDEFTPDANNEEYCCESCKLADAQQIVEKSSDSFDLLYYEERNEYYENIKILL